jgi:hypothetical protein
MYIPFLAESNTQGLFQNVRLAPQEEVAKFAASANTRSLRIQYEHRRS